MCLYKITLNSLQHGSGLHQIHCHSKILLSNSSKPCITQPWCQLCQEQYYHQLHSNTHSNSKFYLHQYQYQQPCNTFTHILVWCRRKCLLKFHSGEWVVQSCNIVFSRIWRLVFVISRFHVLIAVSISSWTPFFKHPCVINGD